MPQVRRLRPHVAWEDLVRVLNGQLPPGRPDWTVERLIRAVKRYIRDGLLEPRLLDRAKRSDADDRLLVIVAGIAGAAPDMTLQAICDRLEAMRERTPRGRARWQPSSVRMLLERAETLGFL